MSEYLWNKAKGQEKAVLVLAHGAGASMDSSFMEDIAQLLSGRGVTVVRFEFPYMVERRVNGKKRPPDRAPKLLDSWRITITDIQKQVSSVPLYIGGKSMGGRMATLVVAEGEGVEGEGVEGVAGVVCLGYPFYATGKPEKPRIDHLRNISLPVLVLQGERDAMGNQEAVAGYDLSDRIEICWLADGNHDLKPRKASGLTHEQHLATTAEKIESWIMGVR
ncbi:alpha/beta family hydrolase [Parendozoicomonas sp. Alg238-R29]|uniref:alpha/beta family hydrolase n=1 Tax=Parendozoicomonas sp. Alg238-R29 TaxID=2993446 RepID=UPI00248E92E4|nr:alpha/beta family hydrolase [Parendozoicomonas sp. Alg238-R29]